MNTQNSVPIHKEKYYSKRQYKLLECDAIESMATRAAYMYKGRFDAYLPLFQVQEGSCANSHNFNYEKLELILEVFFFHFFLSLIHSVPEQSCIWLQSNTSTAIAIVYMFARSRDIRS